MKQTYLREKLWTNQLHIVFYNYLRFMTVPEKQHNTEEKDGGKFADKDFRGLAIHASSAIS